MQIVNVQVGQTSWRRKKLLVLAWSFFEHRKECRKDTEGYFIYAELFTQFKNIRNLQIANS